MISRLDRFSCWLCRGIEFSATNVSMTVVSFELASERLQKELSITMCNKLIAMLFLFNISYSSVSLDHLVLSRSSDTVLFIWICLSCLISSTWIHRHLSWHYIKDKSQDKRHHYETRLNMELFFFLDCIYERNTSKLWINDFSNPSFYKLGSM